jgi:hypothetical protein
MVMYHIYHKPFAQFVKEPISLKPQSSSTIVGATHHKSVALEVFLLLKQD